MRMFSNILTIKIGLFAGGISFLITTYKAFCNINEFHGNIVELLFYLSEGLFASVFNGAIAFCLCGLLVFFPVKLLENRMNWYYMEKTKKEKERLAKERQEDDNGESQQQLL